MSHRQTALLVCALLLSGCDVFDTKPLGVIGSAGPIFGGAVADEPSAALIARDALSAGGSAADAAVALYFGLAATYPIAAGLGGGGMCVVRSADRLEAPGDRLYRRAHARGRRQRDASRAGERPRPGRPSRPLWPPALVATRAAGRTGGAVRHARLAGLRAGRPGTGCIPFRRSRRPGHLSSRRSQPARGRRRHRTGRAGLDPGPAAAARRRGASSRRAGPAFFRWRDRLGAQARLRKAARLGAGLARRRDLPFRRPYRGHGSRIDAGGALGPRLRGATATMRPPCRPRPRATRRSRRARRPRLRSSTAPAARWRAGSP